MDTSRFIAKRIRFGGHLAVASIAISFFVIIIAQAVSAGFRVEIRNGISQISGDVQVAPADLNLMSEDDPLDYDEPYLRDLTAADGVSAVIPAVYRAGIVRSDKLIQGVVFKGVPEGGDSLRVSIPSKLSKLLSIGVGDKLTSYFIGEKVKIRSFTVASIYPSVLSGEDNIVVFAGLSDMQRLNNWDPSEVSALEVILDDAHKDNASLKAVSDAIADLLVEEGEGEVALSALQRYPQIFSWLDLIDANVLLILVLMILVAGFNMISGLLILLFRNISTIGTLKSLGMTDRNISKVFLRVASNLVLKGMLIGNAAALLLCLLQSKTHFLRLDPENYFLSFVPTHPSLFAVLVLDLIAFTAIMLLLTIPCLMISGIDPAKTVRAQ